MDAWGAQRDQEGLLQCTSMRALCVRDRVAWAWGGLCAWVIPSLPTTGEGLWVRGGL